MEETGKTGLDMKEDDSLAEIHQAKQKWEEKTLKPALSRFKLKEAPTRFYSPLDQGAEFDFLNKVGFPGQYPFTASTFPTFPYSTGERGAGGIAQAPGLVRAGRYSGYGSAEDTRDYYLHMQKLGQRAGPNLAFDLPTQCGYDADNPVVAGEVGRVGVAVSTLRDMELIFEAFRGTNDLDRTASNFTINAPANIIMAMCIALADKRGIPREKLRGTPQNDILKEFVARGTYIFPPCPSMRMFRDSAVFFTRYLPRVNINGMGGYHIREAGATGEQTLAFSLANGVAYLQEGVNAGLAVDRFCPPLEFQRLQRKYGVVQGDRLSPGVPPHVGANSEGEIRSQKRALDDAPRRRHRPVRGRQLHGSAASQQPGAGRRGRGRRGALRRAAKLQPPVR